MAKYYGKTLRGAKPQHPPIGRLTGLQPMRGPAVDAIMRAQDQIPGAGRRVLATAGLRGQTNFLDQVDDDHVVLRARVRMTPGSFIEAVALVVPSGFSVFSTHGVSFQDGGEIVLNVTWSDEDASSEISTHTVDITGLVQDLPTGAGALWNWIRVIRIPLITPEGIRGNKSLANTWTRPPQRLTLTVSHQKHTRLVDLAIVESPTAITMEADDDGELWVSHCYGADGLLQLPSTVPRTRLSETTPDGNPRGGTLHTMDVHSAQAQWLGPMLIHFADRGVETTSTSFVSLLAPGASPPLSYDEDNPGWHLGNYAHLYKDHNNLALRGKNGVVPVRIWVYASHTGSNFATLRVQSAEYSWIDVDIGSLETWYTAYGELRCGVSPEDPAVVQMFIKMPSGGGTLSVKDVVVYYDAGAS